MRRIPAFFLLGAPILFAFFFCSVALSSGRLAIAHERWRVVDLTHELSEDIPVFPGGIPFKKEAEATFESSGYLAHRLTLGEHTGTHVDAPIHFQPQAPSVDALDLADLIGPGIRVSIWEKVRDDPDALLMSEDLTRWEELHGPIPPRAVVLVDTGWADRWPDPTAYRNADPGGAMHFPGVSREAAELLRQRGILAVGIDTLSIDPGSSVEFEVHKVFAQAKITVMENLTGLDRLPVTGFTVVVAPLKIRGGSGSPTRVFAVLHEEQ